MTSHRPRRRHARQGRPRQPPSILRVCMVRRASNAGPFARLSPCRRIARLAMRRRSLRLYRASHIDPRGQCSRARKRGAGGTGSGLRGWLSCSCWSRSPGCAAPWWTRSARACGAELPASWHRGRPLYLSSGCGTPRSCSVSSIKRSSLDFRGERLEPTERVAEIGAPA